MKIGGNSGFCVHSFTDRARSCAAAVWPPRRKPCALALTDTVPWPGGQAAASQEKDGPEAPSGTFLSHRASGGNQVPIPGAASKLCWAGWPGSHPISVSGLRKAGPAPWGPAKAARGRADPRAPRGGRFLPPPEDPSGEGLPEALEEPQDSPRDGQEGPAAAESPAGGRKPVVGLGHRATRRDPQLRGPGGRRGRGGGRRPGPICVHVAHKPRTTPGSQRQRRLVREVGQLEQSDLRGQGLAPSGHEGPVPTRAQGLGRAPEGLAPGGVPPPTALRPWVLLENSSPGSGARAPGAARTRTPRSLPLPPALRNLRNAIKTLPGLGLQWSAGAWLFEEERDYQPAAALVWGARPATFVISFRPLSRPVR